MASPRQRDARADVFEADDFGGPEVRLHSRRVANPGLRAGWRRGRRLGRRGGGAADQHERQEQVSHGRDAANDRRSWRHVVIV